MFSFLQLTKFDRQMAVVLVFSCVGAFGSQLASAQQVQQAVEKSEHDRWAGSSLGIRLDFSEEFPRIEKIHSYVATASPFLEDDQLLELGPLDFATATGDDLSEWMKTSRPGLEIEGRVLRGEEELIVRVRTFRKELLDIAAIFARLSTNRIIKDHLEATQRKNLFDNFRERMAAAVRNSQSPRIAAESINRIIDEIGVSHTALIPASSGIGFSDQPKGGLGFILQRQEINGRAGYFVVDKKPGSPSYESAIKLGDEILTVNGLSISESRRLGLSGHENRYQLFVIAADIDEVCEIEYLRTPFDDSGIVKLVAAKDLSTVNTAKASLRTYRSGEASIGYLRFWNLMSMGVNGVLSEAANQQYAECDAIILDLRGRGGIIPAVLALNRTVSKFDKPVVVTIDGLTRSAKEMLTYLLKKQENVLVVGQKTSGAVTGATVMQLPSGNSLMYPVASADMLKQFIDGAILEGVGVEPDEFVEHFVPYCAGEDRILNHAILRAVELAKVKDQVAGSIE